VIYRFEEFELDTERCELRRRGQMVDLEPQVFDVLTYLVEHADRIARKEDILAAVWGTTFVSDAALTTRIKEARQAIGDNGREQRQIKTVHGRGYRFVAPVSAEAAAARAALRPGRVRFCTTSDGVRVAFATTGEGRPFVKAANWLTHIEYDEQSPVWRHLIRDLSRDFTFVRYDQRGCGLSDRELDDDSFSLEAWVRDLEAVVDTLEPEPFPLLGISQGGAIAISYAIAYPERVSHLVLMGAYGRGRARRGGATDAEVHRALMTLTREGWGVEHSTHAQMFAASLIPRGTPEQLRWLVDLQRVSASSEGATRIRDAFGSINVEHLLSRLTVPTLVLHSRGDQTVPFEEGRRLAAGIPNARLVPLDSDNHVLLEDEPAWPQALAEIRDFVREQAPVARPR
jgi:pimeloyl-ACP methyl ester carboxylesterase/DNA-binding winged helix-turn-helix (wHTH) protein